MNKFTTLVFVLLSTPLFAKVPLEYLRDSDLKEELHQEASHGHISFSYNDARVKMFNEVHLEKDSKGYFIKDVYCLDKFYPFNGENPGNRLPNPNVFNTEHTWPQSKFSTKFSKNVQKTDLHHLFPTFSKINSERGNFPFAEVTDEDNISCDESRRGSPISGEEGTYFEPPMKHKGNVARAMFYFSVRYQIAIDPIQEKFLRNWHEQDPVDAEEKVRNEKVYGLQKNRNPFVDRPELVLQISDF